MGENTLNEYFYKPGYKAKGTAEKALFDAKLDVADAGIKANKDYNINIVRCGAYDHPDDAITAIGASNKTLIVTEVETCDTNFTVPANVTVKFERGGKWTINTGITVTFNGQIDAGLWQIFALIGTGTVVLNSGSCAEVYPEWWGAKGDGSTDDAAVFNSVLTQLNASEVKIMKLNNYEYKIRDTIVLYSGISIIGNNKSPVSLHQFPTAKPATRIKFLPTSEKDLFDLTQNLENSYLSKVHISGIHLWGNTPTNGNKFSRYAINSKAAQSVFENIGIAWFQVGIYCNYTMTNKYRDIYIGNCSTACIDTSTDANTTDIFDNVIMRDAPWGAILKRAHDFRFINCLFESLTVGGVNLYKECSVNNFISCYGENIPSSADGDNYGMFYINHDGTTISNTNSVMIVGGSFAGNGTTSHGSFLSVGETSGKICVTGTLFLHYVNGIKTHITNTDDYSVYLTGLTFYDVTNNYVDTTDKLSVGFEVNSASLINGISDETGSGKLVFGTSPTLVTPILGVAAATSINLTGGQIAFPAAQAASANANTLDDYEEGTWTMGVSFGGGVTGITYGNNTGYYTKVGNIVTISGYMALTAKGTSTGTALVTGLPFTCYNNLAALSAVSLMLRYVTFANQFMGNVVINTTTIELWETTEAGVRTTLTDADFANNSVIAVNCTYRIA